MKKSIPGLQCDDDDDNDDDDAATDDDDANGNDDDVSTDDDSVPDDYWKCLKEYEDVDSCSGAGCTWCDTKAGYGICMDKGAAESASKSDWFDCKMSSSSFRDPYDTSCLAASLQGDESTCEATVDLNGEACEWCSVASVNLCLNSDQAEIAEQVGGDCSSPETFEGEELIEDPYDTSCLAASLQGDEATCEATVDPNGEACEWCSVASVNLCLTSDQAEIAEQVGGDCSGPDKFEGEELIGDPYDTSCLAASLQGDESTCEATVDPNGEACEWCSVASVNLCLTSDQAEIAEQVGGDCSSPGAFKGEELIEDPYDTSCLAASLQGDEATCEAAVDQNGEACEWCSVASVNLCLTSDQAEIAEQVGGDCSSPDDLARTSSSSSE
jgi:hypothetical protein